MIDLIEELRRIEDKAAAAMQSLDRGTATTGVTALQQIRHMASDARRHAMDAPDARSRNDRT